MGWLILFAILAVCFIQFKSTEKKQNAIQESIKRNEDSSHNRLSEMKKIVNIPENARTINTIEHVGGYLYYSFKFFIWVENDELVLFPANAIGKTLLSNSTSVALNEDRIVKNIIPINRILFYRQLGSVYTTVSGSGGESSFSYITGFHGKINPIKITSEVHDERSTQLFYDDGQKDCVLVFQENDFYTLKQLIPLKDYDVIIISQGIKSPDDSIPNDDFMRLDKIAKLHEAGLITDEEYMKKKEEILAGI